MESACQFLAIFGFIVMTIGAFVIHTGLGIIAIGIWLVVFSSQNEGGS